MSLIHNERLKLTANWLNTIAAGMIIAGAVTPLVALVYGLSNIPVGRPYSFVALAMAAWILAGTTLHISARTVLGKMQP